MLDDNPTGDTQRGSRARRARGSNGGILKRNTRLAQLAAAITTPFFAATGLLADTWWKDAGIWALDTANANCLDTACGKMLCKSEADAQFLQETKSRTLETIDAAKRRLRTLGWSAHLSLARTTEAGEGSRGCAVAGRKGVGISPADEGLVAEEFRHRFAAAFINTLVLGGIHSISVYLKDSEGLSEYNLRVLQEAAALARTLGGPWIMAGD